MLNPRQAVDRTIRHFADFSGRSRRSEFWWSVLFFGLILGLVSLFDAAVFGREYPSGYYDLEKYNYFQAWWIQLKVYPFSTILGMVLMVPIMAVGVRRMHDVGRSGLWSLIPDTIGWTQAPNLDLSQDLQLFSGPLAGIIWSMFIVYLLISVRALIFSLTDGDYNKNQYGLPVKQRKVSR